MTAAEAGLPAPAPRDRTPGGRAGSYAIGLLAALGALVLRWLAEPWLQDGLPFVTLFGAVAVTVWLGGVGPALACAALGAVVAAGAWLADKPAGMGLFSTADWIGLLGYALSCGLIVFAGAALRRTRRAAGALRNGEASRQNDTLERQVALRTATLQASEARLRTIFSTSDQHQGLLAPDGTVLDANPTLLNSIDATLASVVGKPVWDTPWFAGTPGMPHAMRQHVAAAAAGKSFRQELTLQLPAGRRVFDFAMRPVPAADGAPSAIVTEAVDVTERHAAEDQLRQAHKMEAVGQLTGGVAHDFNNLLQVISANLHLIGRYAEGNERVQQRVANAQGAVGRGARLASQLLAFGRRQALEPKVVNIGRFVAGMEDLLRRSLGEGVEIQTIVSGGLWHTFVDPNQVESAVLGLAINARDAMNGHGKLTIEVGNADLDEAYARAHNEVTAGQYVMVAVTDSGAGMTPDVMAQAFEPFFSTKPAGSGSGLGLSMIYGFVRQSGGHVKIYSEVGEGTTIKLYLPHTHRQEDALQSLPGGVVAGGAETVLVVEDDEGVRATTVEMLGALGYQVLKAADAASALTLLESGAPVDLLFTDVVMPGKLKSIDLARRARELRPGIAVLFTSGYTRNAIVHNGRLDMGVELLPKPYTSQALARRVRGLLDRAAADRAAKPAGGPAPLQILLVEDDDLVRTSAAEIIADLGHHVAQARSAQEAMGVLRQTPVDVLVTDVGLPDQAGDVFAAEARALRPRMRIIFATGSSRIPDMGRSLGVDTGGPVLLRKPYDSAAIRQALEAVAA